MTVYEQMNATIDHILVDEALTDGLDDQAAKRLLSWGLKLISNIRGEEDEDDEDALLDTSDDVRIFAGLASIPELLEQINHWIRRPQNEETNRAQLAEVIQKMQLIQGNVFRQPRTSKQKKFLKELAKPATSPEEKIKQLIELFASA